MPITHHGIWWDGVYFHLAENKASNETPFAFLATYTTRLSEEHAPKHVPLGRALEEYAGENNKSALLTLLLPIQKAAATSTFIKHLFESGDIISHPQSWTPRQAHSFLQEAPLLETSGILVRIPNWWNVRKPSRPTVSVSLGENAISQIGLDGMLDFNISLTLSNGEELSQNEWNDILTSKDSFIKVKGQWIEVDQARAYRCT